MCSGLVRFIIETLWNVKKGELTVIQAFYERFNRDIVECKDQRRAINILSGHWI